MTRPFLSVENLVVHFPTPDGVVRATDGLSYTVEPGKTLGIVGESGSGKSVSSSAILGLHRNTSAQVSGRIWLNGVDLLSLSDKEMQARRGKDVAMIFQDPLSALHPYYTIGDQVAEAYRVHNKVSRKAARDRAIEMLDRVGIPNPQVRVDDYPHQFSGGMRQRVVIAIAVIADPELLIADEPTTALDVRVQAQVLELLHEVADERGMSVLLITHDLAIVAGFADEVVVMRHGEVVESAGVDALFASPQHPYTRGLLGAVPRIDADPTTRLRSIDEVAAVSPEESS